MFDNLFILKESEEGDYYENGFLFCGNCKCRREMMVDIGETRQKVSVLCKCREEISFKRESEERERERMVLVAARRSEALRDHEMHTWTFERDDKSDLRLSEAMQRYCNNFSVLRETGKGILLYGGLGTGKSYYAACIVNRLVDKYTARFVSTAYLATINFNDRKEFMREIDRVDLVVLDDIGAERGTEYMQELIFSIVDSRSRNKKPLIVTTNLNGEQIRNAPDIGTKRIFDRINGMCHPICVKGDSRRKARAKSEYEATQKLLGL